MKTYQCHKKVKAFKIDFIMIKANNKVYLQGIENTDEVAVDMSYCSKHRPTVGGYYVQYKDGYESYSPAKAFEDGYTQID